MSFQAKLVDPNGSPKAVVATHDRVASGTEFALFSSLLGVMALGAVPTEEFDSSGRQMFRLVDPDELVNRAEKIVQAAMLASESNGWTVTTDDIDELYRDHGARKPAGFRSDDDIPF